MEQNVKRIVTCLSQVDFDALASMLCVCKLYPETVAIKHDAVEEQVTRFLGIYKDLVELVHLKEINKEAVETLTIVDTRPSSRVLEYLKYFPNLRRCVVADHHDTADETEHEEYTLYLRAVGSTTTMLVPLLKKRKVYISPQEATLMLTAIYEDTASLISPTTKPEDLEVASYLMSLGGNLQVVRRFINSSLSKRGKDILGIFLNTIEIIPMGGILVAIACVKYHKYVDNLAFITHKLFDLVEADAIFTASAFAGKTYFVGRSLDERLVDCAKVLSHFGGGGHKTASAANIKGELNPTLAFTRLVRVCEEEIAPPPTVASIMNYPVKTISPSETFQSAKQKQKRFGHGGLPVVNRGKLIGIVTRRDLDKVPPEMEHKPVKRFMTPNPLTIEASSSIVEARRLMMKHGVGRLPVLESGEMVGIITRSDVLSANFWHRGQDIGPYPLPTKLSKDQTKELYSRLPDRMKDILEQIIKIAYGLDVAVFLVGGAVRDMVLDRTPDDLDILVEGDAINLAYAVARVLDGKVISHDRFGTAQIILSDIKIDLAGARAEYYREPGSHPNVVKTSIYEDLKRRDFTVNALAISLTGADSMKIIDVCGGLEDINQKKIKILHNLSFVEDPTRVLRAVYYAALLDFELDKKTTRYAREAVSTGLLATSKNERTAQELLRILSHEKGGVMLAKLKTLKGVSEIFGTTPLYFSVLLKRIYRLYEFATELGFNVSLAKLRMLALSADIEDNKLVDTLTRLKLPGKFIEQISASKKNSYTLKKKLVKEDRVEIFKQIGKESDETIVYSCLTTRLSSSLKLLQLLARIKAVKLEISGNDLINLGMKPGKAVGSVLSAVLVEKVAGRVITKTQELTLARRLMG